MKLKAERSLPGNLWLPRSGKSEVPCEGALRVTTALARDRVHTGRDTGWKDPAVQQSQTVQQVQMVEVRRTLHGHSPDTS